MRSSVFCLALAALVGSTAAASTGPARDRGVEVRFVAPRPALPAAQEPREQESDYEKRETHARDLEEFSGGAIGLIAAVLIVILILILI
jgi:hypothetical protein